VEAEHENIPQGSHDLKMTDEDLLAIVQTEFKNAVGGPGGEISKERALAWERYLSEPFGNEVEGESEVVTSDVAEIVDGIMPSLLRIFTTADNLTQFDAVGEEDVAAAEQESDYVNHVFFKEQKNAFMLMFFWFFDALVSKIGIVMAWWDESEKITYESYENLNEVELAELLDDDELEALERSETESGDLDELGEPVILHSVKFRRIEKRPGKVNIECVPPDEYRISNDSRGLDPSDARMVGRERPISRSDLVSMGFDKDQVYKLPAIDATTATSAEKRVRKRKTDDTLGKPVDKSREEILVCVAYIKVDYDGDGRSELRQVYTGGGELLKWKDGKVANETVDRQPFHVICPRPLPHKHIGQSVAEIVIDVMETSTTLLRQVLNNLYRTNNPGHAVDERRMSENTLDDLLTTRIGRVARFAGNPNEAYAPMTVPFTAGATFPMLEYFDKVKRDRTGVRADSEALSPESLKNIQQSVLSAAVDISKAKIETIARIFAETGIKSLFLHIHEMLLKHQDKAKVVRLRNRFVEVHPASWRTREDMTVQIGLGIGTREQNLIHLNAIGAKQAEIIQGGGMNLVVTPRNVFNTASELVKNANLKDPSMFFTDPGDQKAPPPSDEQQELQKMQAELEARQQQLDGERQQIAKAKLEVEIQKMQLGHERELQRLDEDRESREDKWQAENERLKNDLLEMKARFEKLPHEIANIDADTMVKRAAAAKTMEEARAQDIENDSVESGALEFFGGPGGETEEAE